MPNPAIKNSLASPSMLAHIMTRKYVEAIPLYRQEQQFKRFGINLSRQTLANWVIKASSSWLTPLYEAMHQELITKEILHADETVLEVLCEPGREPSTQSYMWLYRTGRDDTPIVLYEYTQGRSGDYAKKFLQGFKGYIHTDGYAGYHKLSENPGPGGGDITLVGCWAHARRKYDEALKAVGQRIPQQRNNLSGREYCNHFHDRRESRFFPRQSGKFREKKASLLEAYFAWAAPRNELLCFEEQAWRCHQLQPEAEKILEIIIWMGGSNQQQTSGTIHQAFVIGRKNCFSKHPKGC